jgi:indole-3-glycerol phosphate synthase
MDTLINENETTRRHNLRIPADKIVVAESGIRDRKDIESLMDVGINAFLIGEALITAPDIGVKLRTFKGEN